MTTHPPALVLLRRTGPATAQTLARRMRVPLETIYSQLVPAEGAGLVRIVVDSKLRNTEPVRRWEAM